DNGSDLTRTLTTFGTPGYIAPEQAESAAGELAPTADIYSLGAILFHLLSGRAPFVGANVLSVIRQAAATTAPRLRSLTPSLDRDLETIVARCLEREPQARYQTADGLAEDLDRWLEGRPILVRRVLLPAHIWRWARRNPVLAGAITGCLLLAAAVIWLLGGVPATVAISKKSIAVLPFENLSEDKTNAYFVGGMQDEILTELAKVADLKVISRSSVMRYESGTPRNLREIGKQLGVAHLLEGSVQRAGGKIRVNAQLIDASSDTHLWAKTYDRDLADVFYIQSEIAKTIADQLQAKLTAGEKSTLARKPTTSFEAYDAYLRGLAYSLRPVWSEADNLNAIKYFGEAVKLDPKFTLAWVWLAHTSAHGYFDKIGDDFPALREAAKHAADKVVELQPDLGEAYEAQGYVHYYCERDYDSAILSFKKAAQLSPNNSQILEALGQLCRRKGQWQSSLDYFQQAVEINPRDAPLSISLGDVLRSARQYKAALKVYDHILDMFPGNLQALEGKLLLYHAQGNLPAGAALLSSLSPETKSDLLLMQISQWEYERRYADAIVALKKSFLEPTRPSHDWYYSYVKELAWLQQLSGDAAAARVTWQQVQSEVEALRVKGPEYNTCELAWAYVALGEKAKAFAIVEPNTATWDAVDTLYQNEMMAQVAVQAGERNLALEQLAICAKNPVGESVTYGNLKLSPLWDPLRGDPRFEKIVASLAPKETASK
ncbi:MAG: tetratricopeptide repeat protein, partial [Chthoniobacterales bacterium]